MQLPKETKFLSLALNFHILFFLYTKQNNTNIWVEDGWVGTEKRGSNFPSCAYKIHVSGAERFKTADRGVLIFFRKKDVFVNYFESIKMDRKGKPS